MDVSPGAKVSFYDAWCKRAYAALEIFEMGLCQLNVDPILALASDIDTIRTAVHDASCAYQQQDHPQFIISHLKIQSMLNALLHEGTIASPEAALFFLSAQYTYNHLLCIVYTTQLNDTEASSSLQPELKKLRTFIESDAGKQHINNVLTHTTDVIISLFKAAVGKMSEKLTVAQHWNSKEKKPLLNDLIQDQLGEKYYAKSHTEQLFHDSQRLSVWVKKEIRKIIFDHFYILVYRLYQIKKITHLTSSHNKALGSTKRLLSALGMAALSEKKFSSYIERIAQCLGFNSADDLYENFYDLRSQDQFNRYHTCLQQFVAPTTVDPISRIFHYTRSEKERISVLLSKQKYLNENYAYIQLLLEITEHLSVGLSPCTQIDALLQKSQKNDSLFKHHLHQLDAVKDYLLFEKNIDNDDFKKRIIQDVFFPITLSCLHQQQLLKNIEKKSDDLWVTHRKAEIKKNILSKKISHQDLSTLSEKELIQIYIDTQEQYQKQYRNLKATFLKKEPQSLTLLTRDYYAYLSELEKHLVSKIMLDSTAHLEAFHAENLSIIEDKNRMLEELNAEWEASLSSVPHSTLVEIIANRFARSSKEYIEKAEQNKQKKEKIRNEIVVRYHVNDIISRQIQFYHTIASLGFGNFLNEIQYAVAQYLEYSFEEYNYFKLLDINQIFTEKFLEIKRYVTIFEQRAIFLTTRAIQMVLEKPDDFKTEEILNFISNIFLTPSFNLNSELLLFKALNTLNTLIADILKIRSQEIEGKKMSRIRLLIKTEYTQDSIFYSFDLFERIVNKIRLENIFITPSLKKFIYHEIFVVAQDFISSKSSGEYRRLLETMAINVRRACFSAPAAEKIYYQQLIDVIENSIQSIYMTYTSDTHSEKKRLFFEELDADFISYYQEFVDTRKKTNRIYQIYHHWIASPFSTFQGRNILNKLAANEVSEMECFSKFCLRYVTVLKFHAPHIADYLKNLDKYGIESHTQRLEKEYRALHRMIEENADNQYSFLLETIKIQNVILKISKNILHAHPENRVKFIIHEHQKLMKQFNMTCVAIKQIEQKLIVDVAFDEDSFLKLGSMLANVDRTLHILKDNMQHVEYHDTQNKIYQHWKCHSMELTYQLEEVDNFMKKIDTVESVAFKFYYQIVLNESLDIPMLDAKHYGIGLLLAIQHDHYAIGMKIIDFSGKNIHVHYLARALHLASKKNQPELLKKIYTIRSDITFNNADLLTLLSLALQRKQHFVVQDILLHTTVELDASTIEQLQNNDITKQNNIAPVRKNLFQRIIDTDGMYLENIRLAYEFQCNMLNVLGEEYLSLKKQFYTDDSSNEYFIQKIERTYQIKDMMVRFYEYEAFADVSRKQEHIIQWEAQIESIYEKYFVDIETDHAVTELTLEREKIKAAIMYVIENHAHIETLLPHLAKLNILLRERDQSGYYRLISEAICHAVTCDKALALDTLLASIEEPDRKTEYAFNAFSQALKTLKIHCVRYWLLHHMNNNFTSEALVEINNLFLKYQDEVYHGEASIIKSIIILCLSSAPFTFDLHVMRFVESLAPHSHSVVTKISKTTTEKLSKSSDLLLLEKLRSVYLFNEQCIQKIHDDCWEIRSEIEQSREDYHGEFHQNHYYFYKALIKCLEKNINNQFKNIKNLKSNYIKYVLDNHSVVHDPARLHHHIAIWDADLLGFTSRLKNIIHADIQSLKKML